MTNSTSPKESEIAGVEMPEPDIVIIALDKIARDYDHYEYGLPIDTSKIPLVDYTDGSVLENMRSVVRAYGEACARAATAAERNACAKIAAMYSNGKERLHPDILWVDMSDEARRIAHWTAQNIAAAIRAQK
jgi:hypothetical protein